MTGHRFINQPAALEEFCQEIAPSPRVAIDTEFIPEGAYLPELCLIQVATDAHAAIIDPLAIADLAPFWETLLQPHAEVVMHAGKEEVCFFWEQAGRAPTRVFDVQLAAGLIGLGYPLSLANLVQKVVGKRLETGETRTDWRQRPLSRQQVDYAINDVRYLLEIRDRIDEQLQQRGRQEWFNQETLRMADAIYRLRNDPERWRRLSGISGFSPRELAVARALYQWREDRARRLNKPVRWILRDDVLVTLAKRKPTSMSELLNTRGVGNPGKNAWPDQVIEVIRDALKLPDDQLPRRPGQQHASSVDDQMIFKLLSIVVAQLADQNDVALTLLGSSEDIRDYFDWRRTGSKDADRPKLGCGWQGEVCGQALDNLLAGRTRLRIDPKKMTLIFESSSSTQSDA